MENVRLFFKLALIQLRTHPYVEFSDTGTASFFIDVGSVDRVRVG